MKSTLLTLILLIASVNASASNLECRLMGINEGPTDVSPILVEASQSAKEIGSIAGIKVSVSQVNGHLVIYGEGSTNVQAVSRSNDLALSIEGATISCIRTK